MLRPLRRARYALLVALAALPLALPATPAGADPTPDADLDCTVDVFVTTSPGITFQAQDNRSASDGPADNADCGGTVGDQTVTGIGDFEFTSKEVSSCVTGGVGTAKFELELPTTGGTQEVSGKFDLNPGPGGETLLTGDLTGVGHVTGILEGDCSTGVTRLSATLTFHVGA